jgi:hypothetical protein
MSVLSFVRFRRGVFNHEKHERKTAYTNKKTAQFKGGLKAQKKETFSSS